MMSLFDEEQIIKSFIRSERYDTEQASLKKSALAMIKLGKIAFEEVASCFPDVTEEKIKELKAEVIRLA